MSLGFEQSGFTSVLAVDSDEWSAATYAFNRAHLQYQPKVVVGDLASMVVPEDLGTIDVIMAGIPCQAFSRANQQPRIGDHRLALWEHTVEWVANLRPMAFVFENVLGFAATAVHLSHALSTEGYATVVVPVDAMAFGIPQARRRLIGLSIDTRRISNHEELLQAFRHSLESAHADHVPVLSEAIGDLPALEPSRVRNQPHHESVETGHALAVTSGAGVSNWVQRINNDRQVPVIFNHKARYNNDRDIAIFGALAPGGDSTSDAISDLMPYTRRSSIFKDKYYRLQDDAPCRTITAHMRYDCNSYIHPSQPRGLTAREAARVQGFPDDYAFLGTFQRTYQQVGNAVPPPLARAVGDRVRQLLEAAS